MVFFQKYIFNITLLLAVIFWIWYFKTSTFLKPSLEWKTRTITLNDWRVLTYKFWSWNPIWASPLSNKEKEAYSNCIHEPELSQISCGIMNNEVFWYITSDIENDLFTLLSHPSWEKILNTCESQFRRNEYPDLEVNYDEVFYGDSMSMEKIITIDYETGRKELRFGSFAGLRWWFINSLRERSDVVWKDVFSINNCITENGGIELYRLMDVIYQKQFYPFWLYPERIINPQKYIPWY